MVTSFPSPPDHNKHTHTRWGKWWRQQISKFDKMSSVDAELCVCVCSQALVLEIFINISLKVSHFTCWLDNQSRRWVCKRLKFTHLVVRQKSAFYWFWTLSLLNLLINTIFSLSLVKRTQEGERKWEEINCKRKKFGKSFEMSAKFSITETTSISFHNLNTKYQQTRLKTTQIAKLINSISLN